MNKPSPSASRRKFLKTSAALSGVSLLELSDAIPSPILSPTEPSVTSPQYTTGNGRVVLITGTSSGFGRLMALTFARRGWVTIATMRNLSTRNAATADELRRIALAEKLPIHLVEIDIDQDKSVAKGVTEALALTEGRIDVLINNAGYSVSGPLECQSIELVQAMYNTNVFGAQRMIRAVLPTLRAQRCGLVMQVSTRIGRMGMPRVGTYAATKWALEGMYATLRYELAPLGIDVALLEPGVYPTPFHRKTAEGMNALLAQMNQSAVDRQRLTDYADHLNRYETIATRIAAITPEKVNPQIVADAALSVAALPAGQRPFRTPLGSSQEVALLSELNRLNDRIEQTFIEHTGFGDWLKMDGGNCLVR